MIRKVTSNNRIQLEIAKERKSLHMRVLAINNNQWHTIILYHTQQTLISDLLRKGIKRSAHKVTNFWINLYVSTSLRYGISIVF